MSSLFYYISVQVHPTLFPGLRVTWCGLVGVGQFPCLAGKWNAKALAICSHPNVHFFSDCLFTFLCTVDVHHQLRVFAHIWDSLSRWKKKKVRTVFIYASQALLGLHKSYTDDVIWNGQAFLLKLSTYCYHKYFWRIKKKFKTLIHFHASYSFLWEYVSFHHHLHWCFKTGMCLQHF